MARPSSFRPSSAKKAMASSRDSTTMPTLSIRSNLFFVIVVKVFYLIKFSIETPCALAVLLIGGKFYFKTLYEPIPLLAYEPTCESELWQETR
jgi:hypothetical protein